MLGCVSGAQLAKTGSQVEAAEVLKMGAADNAELLAMSGPRNPYPGKLGVIEERALADLLLVDGDPIGNIKLNEDPGTNFVVIMKDGKAYKNTLIQPFCRLRKAAYTVLKPSDPIKTCS